MTSLVQLRLPGCSCTQSPSRRYSSGSEHGSRNGFDAIELQRWTLRENIRLPRKLSSHRMWRNFVNGLRIGNGPSSAVRQYIVDRSSIWFRETPCKCRHEPLPTMAVDMKRFQPVEYAPTVTTHTKRQLTTVTITIVWTNRHYPDLADRDYKTTTQDSRSSSTTTTRFHTALHNHDTTTHTTANSHHPSRCRRLLSKSAHAPTSLPLRLTSPSPRLTSPPRAKSS